MQLSHVIITSPEKNITYKEKHLNTLIWKSFLEITARPQRATKVVGKQVIGGVKSRLQFWRTWPTRVGAWVCLGMVTAVRRDMGVSQNLSRNSTKASLWAKTPILWPPDVSSQLTAEALSPPIWPEFILRSWALITSIDAPNQKWP